MSILNLTQFSFARLSWEVIILQLNFCKKLLDTRYIGEIAILSGGGGVLVAVKSTYPSVEVELVDTEGEVIWVELSIKNQRKLYLGSFYRPPNNRVYQLEELYKSLQQIEEKCKNNPNSIIIVGGDFNAGDVDWETLIINNKTPHKAVHNKLMEILDEFHLSQMQKSPTREGRVLDLYLTNKPALLKSIHTIPGISDHEIVVADSEIQPMYVRSKPRNITLFNKADWEKIKGEMRTFQTRFLETFNSNTVNENWLALKDFINKLIEEHIPTRTTTTRYNLPWLNASIKRATNKKKRLYKKARKSGKESDWAKYRTCKKETLQALRRARWQYINDILVEGMEENNNKPFWRYIKSQKQENIGVAPLKSGGKLENNSVEKAELLNTQFRSVFTAEDKSFIPSMADPQTPGIEPLSITCDGVYKLLKNLNPAKASGPDCIPARFLKELAEEIAPLLTEIFQQSLSTGEVPEDWTKANVAPIYKKGNKNLAVNYRPVSLTCICCKVMEHVLCSHIHKHLDRYNILTPLQHGFRRGHSCETQLLLTTHDLIITHK